MSTFQRIAIFFVFCALILLVGLAEPVVAGPLPPTDATPLALTDSSNERTIFRADSPAYGLESVDGVDGPCRRIVVEGYESSGQAGAPQLPLRSVLLALPVDAQPRLEILTDSAVRLEGSYRICPAPEAVSAWEENGTVRYEEQATAPDPAIYSRNALFPAAAARIVDEGWMGRIRYVRVEIAPFQYNPADGSLIYHPNLQIQVSHPGAAARSAAPSGADAFTQSVQELFLNGAQAGEWAGTPPATLDAASSAGWQPPLPGLRLFVREEGLYAVTYQELAQAGVPVASLAPRSLRLFLNGQPVAVRVVDSANRDDSDGVFGQDDRLIFYGQGVDEKYTDANVYWLSYGGEDGVRMRTRSAESGGSPAGAYTATVTFEENFNYVSSAPKLPGYNHWYGRLLTVAGANASNSWQIPMAVSAQAGGHLTATVEAAMVSRTRGSHHVKFYVNNTYVGDGRWSDAAYGRYQASFSAGLLVNGNNTLRVEIVNDLDGQTVSVVYLDWLKLHYPRSLSPVADRLIFDSPGPGKWQYTSGDFSAGDLEAYDVTDPLLVERIPLAAGKSAQFGVTETSRRRYLVQSVAQRKSVAAIERADTPDLLATSNRADYFIIAHKEFLGAIQPLADYRAARGLRVAVIDVQHIYDTFNYGRMAPEAIRDFLGYAYSHWQTSGSSYVLLVGDGTFDPRRYRSDSARTFIPPYLEMVDPDLGETAADNRFVTIIGTDRMPDMHLGRLPAESPGDVTAMVNKIIDYESAPADSGWNGRVLFVADDLKGGGGAFYNFSDAIADGSMEIQGETKPLLPAAYQKDKLYLPFDCANGDACRERIVGKINEGALLVSYVGHSAKEYWAEENLLNLSALNQMNNAAYPVMLPMTCLEGYFHEAEQGRTSLGEALVRRSRAGAIASWSATGLGLASGHDYLERGFFIGVFHIGVREIGPATTLGKIYLYANAPSGKYDDLLDTFLLLGDPALKLRTLDSVPEERRYGLFLPGVTR